MPKRSSFLYLFSFMLGVAYAKDTRACHVEYVLQEKDTLESLAHQIYDDPAKWRVIYYANQDRLADGTSLLKPGTAIRLPCAAGNASLPQPASGQPVAPSTPPAARLDHKDALKVIVPFNMTSADGVGAKVGSIVARNERMSIASRIEEALILTPYLQGLPPGLHAFHVHVNPNCGPAEEQGKVVPGLAAGPHLFLKGTGADATVTYHSHLGNLPNLLVEADGTSKLEIAVPRLTLDDIRGRSIVIHATRDDDSARQACGVVP